MHAEITRWTRVTWKCRKFLVAPLIIPVELLLLQILWQVMNGEIIDYKSEYISLMLSSRVCEYIQNGLNFYIEHIQSSMYIKAPQWNLEMCLLLAVCKSELNVSTFSKCLHAANQGMKSCTLLTNKTKLNQQPLRYLNKDALKWMIVVENYMYRFERGLL